MLKKFAISVGAVVFAALVGIGIWRVVDPTVTDCTAMALRGIPNLAEDRADRFLGKVRTDTGTCRGGDRFVERRDTPWVDWANYWGAGGPDSLSGTTNFITKHLQRNGRGVDGALLDLERQRVELIKFNLFDNYTFIPFTKGRDGRAGPILKHWPEMRLPEDHPAYEAVGGDGLQVCSGPLIRHRNVTGICNDIRNPAMGSLGMEFARNMQFEETFPDLELTSLTRNRHGGRIDINTPDAQVISRELLARQQSDPAACNGGYGTESTDVDQHCDYVKAPFFNVLAAYWIQFMTHDWFSHLNEGENAGANNIMPMGCAKIRTAEGYAPLTDAQVKEIGCNPNMYEQRALEAQGLPVPKFWDNGISRMARAPKTTSNMVTAWWDASQIYGYSEPSRQRMKRDPDDPAKLLMRPVPARMAAGDRGTYLPVLTDCAGQGPDCVPDPMPAKWNGQEAAAFPENWSIGLSFLHNLFVREHNTFVDEFRAYAAKPQNRNKDSGLRDPRFPTRVILYKDVPDTDLFEIARLVVAATIAKIHTIEWTTQLLYDEPLRTAMYSNWEGLLHAYPTLDRQLRKVVDDLSTSTNATRANEIYSIFTSGSGITGTGAYKSDYSITNLDDVNGGVNHFGSPFNFPEEFISVYRLHPLLPDMIELRSKDDPNVVTGKLPVVTTFRRKATQAMHDIGLEDIGLSFGRQRLGALSLQNQPAFLQNLRMPYRQDDPGKVLDVIALDIIRDRERGVPRFNEFRRQIGLRQLTSFDDFADESLLIEDGLSKKQIAANKATYDAQMELVAKLREIYGTHICNASKIISTSQRSPDAATLEGQKGTTFPNDCLDKPDGSVVDNVEDLDTIVGYLAETTRPHGFAISETQFQIFIINASRRLFSDRFFTSSFRPEFYTKFGINWVTYNGPHKQMEKGRVNGHRQEVLPLKRLLMRNLPGLRPELEHVINAFDPWGRDRGEYYSLEWTPRPGAETDAAFAKDTK
jgi:hypothetical protein